MSANKYQFIFEECEHEGDLENYASLITRHGGVVLETQLSPDVADEGFVFALVTQAQFKQIHLDDDFGFCERFRQVA